MRSLASSQFASLNTVLTHTGHVLQGAETTQYSTDTHTHIHAGTYRDMYTHARTQKKYKRIHAKAQIKVTYSGAKTHRELHVRVNAYSV